MLKRKKTFSSGSTQKRGQMIKDLQHHHPNTMAYVCPSHLRIQLCLMMLVYMCHNFDSCSTCQRQLQLTIQNTPYFSVIVVLDSSSQVVTAQTKGFAGFHHDSRIQRGGGILFHFRQMGTTILSTTLSKINSY